MIRDAVLTDVKALTELEERCFATDRMSERSFRHILTRGKAALVVDDRDGCLRGYALVLFHDNTSLARLYSICTLPEERGQGIARELLAASEERAMARGATRMRLEVHAGNTAAQKLYHEAGYREFSIYRQYYDDKGDALRMEKELAPHLARDLDRVPFYHQTLDFTCGPACLMMAMSAHDPDTRHDRTEELRLWREATTVFMTSGHGGCGPIGLALAAWRRGFGVELSVRDETELFVDSVRSADKKEVIRLVEKGFAEELAGTSIRVIAKPLTALDLKQRLALGGIPIVLISSYRLTGEKMPHWVVLTAADDRFVYINDPYIDLAENRTMTDCIGIPILPAELDRMTQLGRRKNVASVIIYPKEEARS
jgi:ribosomal protein S18 acetylase RimI-like enzyme